MEVALLRTPQLGRPASSGRSAGCWVARDSQEEELSTQSVTRAAVPPAARAEVAMCPQLPYLGSRHMSALNVQEAGCVTWWCCRCDR